MLHGRLYLRDLKFREYLLIVGDTKRQSRNLCCSRNAPQIKSSFLRGELANVSRHISPEGEQRKAATIRYCGIN